MGDEVGGRHGQAVRTRERGRHRLVAHAANGARIVDGQNARRLRRLQDNQAGTVRDGFEDVGIIAIRGERGEVCHHRLRLQFIDRVTPLTQLIANDHRHRLVAILFLNDKTETHAELPSCRRLSLLLRQAQAARHLVEHGGEFAGTRAVEPVDAPGRDFEKQSRFIELCPPDAVLYLLRCDSAGAHSLTVGVREQGRALLEPLARAGPMIPERGRTQVCQEVADVKRGVGQAEAVEIDDEGAMAVEEQLAGLEAAVRGSIARRLLRFQSGAQSLRQLQYLVCLRRAMACQQGRALARSPRLLHSNAFLSRYQRARVQLRQRARREPQLLFRHDDPAHRAAAPVFSLKTKTLVSRPYPVLRPILARLNRLIKDEAGNIADAERLRQKWERLPGLFRVEGLHHRLHIPCLLCIGVDFAKDRQCLLLTLPLVTLPPDGQPVSDDAATAGLIAHGLRDRRDKLPARVAQLLPRGLLQFLPELALRRGVAAGSQGGQRGIRRERLHRETRLGRLQDARLRYLEFSLLDLLRVEANTCAIQGRFGQRQAHRSLWPPGPSALPPGPPALPPGPPALPPGHPQGSGPTIRRMFWLVGRHRVW